MPTRFATGDLGGYIALLGGSAGSKLNKLSHAKTTTPNKSSVRLYRQNRPVAERSVAEAGSARPLRDLADFPVRGLRPDLFFLAILASLHP